MEKRARARGERALGGGEAERGGEEAGCHCWMSEVRRGSGCGGSVTGVVMRDRWVNEWVVGG